MLWQAVHSPVKCLPLSDALQGFLRSGVRYHVLQVQKIPLLVPERRLQADRRMNGEPLVPLCTLSAGLRKGPSEL